MLRQRARATLPTVLLTLASIIQAVALEMYWNRIADNPALWSLTFDALLGWLLAFAMLCGMLILWVYYAQLVMRFVWVPQIADSLLPFGFGLLEFALIEFMAIEQLPIWFALFGTIFLFAGGASYSTFSRAKDDPENRWFFTSGGFNRWGLLGPTTIAAVVFWLFGLLCITVGPSAYPPLLLVTIAIGLQQLYQQHHYWKVSLQMEERYFAARGRATDGGSAEDPQQARAERAPPD